MAKVFRNDIQALRAFAVTSVIIFHLWPNLLPGGFIGVDVFFVISGYLITSHIARDVELERFKISTFWARRIRRLLPASFTVIAFCIVATILLATNSQKVTLLWETLSSTFYFENWTLAFNAVDYLGQDNAVSPVQHFWSLSVEEQFYLAWPILLTIGLLFSKNLRIGTFKNNSRVILTALTLGSLAYSIYLTAVDPKFAYFATTTRAWEFASGALIAFLPSVANWSKYLKAPLLLIATALLFASAFLLNKELPFPSYLALYPVLGSVLFIWIGIESGFVHRILSIRPVQHLGDISYSAYLWHWPPIILIPMVTHSDIGNLWKSAILIFTLVMATLSRKFIELPFIGLRPEIKALNAKTFAVALVFSLILGGTSQYYIQKANADIEAELKQTENLNLSAPCFGAEARLPDGSICVNNTITKAINPSPELASADNPGRLYHSCGGTSREDFIPKICPLGDRSSNYKVLLIGDSHSAQFRSTMDNLGKSQHWKVDSISKGGCPVNYLQREHDEILTASCTKWVEESIALIKKNKYEFMVTSSISGTAWRTDSEVYPTPSIGFAKVWREINAVGTKILVIKDNPRPMKNIANCLISNPTDYMTKCSMPRDKAFLPEPLREAVRLVDSKDTALLNLDNVYCNLQTCEPVIGKVMVYRDENHLTSTFAKTLQKKFLLAIRKLLAN